MNCATLACLRQVITASIPLGLVEQLGKLGTLAHTTKYEHKNNKQKITISCT